MHPVPPSVRRRVLPTCLALLAALGGVAGGAAPTHATPSFTLTRPADTRDRFATAASIARMAFPEGATEVAVVNGDNPVDALAASGWALTDIPILYVRRDSVPAAAAAALEDLDPEVVHVIGGEGAVSAAVARDIGRGRGRTVQRYDGANRYETAAQLAVSLTEYLGERPETVVLARGDDYADALAAAPWAAKDGAPVLLTRPTVLPDATLRALEVIGPRRVVVVGGEGAVGAGIQNQLVASGLDGLRIEGRDRYETAANVARSGLTGFSRSRVGLANGASLVDALPGAVLLAQSGAPVLLTRPGDLGPAAARYLTDHHHTLLGGVAIGGTGAVPDTVLVQARQAASGPPLTARLAHWWDDYVTVDLPAVPGAAYTVHAAPAVFSGGAYVPAPALPPAGAAAAPGTDSEPTQEGVQVRVGGLTPDTAYDLWVTRAVGDVPPLTGYLDAGGEVLNGSVLLRTAPAPAPSGPSTTTAGAAPRILDVAVSPDGGGLTVDLEPLPEGSRYTVFWGRARYDAQGRYLPPTYAYGVVNDRPDATWSRDVVDGDGRPAAGTTVPGALEPSTGYEVYVVRGDGSRGGTRAAYWNSTARTSQTAATPAPAAPSVTTPAAP
ncbi:hypothetical protein NUM3379_14860 [Kineococcus sp. NUM-3379]